MSDHLTHTQAGILADLAAGRSARVGVRTTGGARSRCLRRMEAVELIERSPGREWSITAAGRAALSAHVNRPATVRKTP